LFGLYLDDKKNAEAEAALLLYRNSFPGNASAKSQEAMVAKILDVYKDSKDIAGMKRIIGLINQGKFTVNKKLAEDINKFLLSIQFEDVENKNISGNKMAALMGYIKLFKSGDTLKDGKKNAAYNISIIFYEMGELKRSYQWLTRALQLMDNNDLLNFENSILLVTVGLFDTGLINESVQISATMLNRLCKVSSAKTNTPLFKNSIIGLLADDQYDEAIKSIIKYRSCVSNSSALKDTYRQVSQYFVDQELWDKLEQYLNTMPVIANDEVSVIYFYKLAQAYLETGNQAKANSYAQKSYLLASSLQSEKKLNDYEARNIYSKLMLRSIKEKFISLQRMPLSFPESVFNQGIKNLLETLQVIIDDSLRNLSIVNGENVGDVYDLIDRSYRVVFDKINKFEPTGVSSDYRNSFKESMKGLVSQIDQKRIDLARQGRLRILEENILSINGRYLLVDRKSDFFPSFVTRPVIMDRSGM